MLSREEFDKNVNKWSLLYPLEAAKIAGLTCEDLQFFKTEKEDLNLKGIFHGEEVFFHSLMDPLGEAKTWFNTLDLKGMEVILVYGVGLGYFYEAAKDWLRQNPNHALVFIESQLPVIQRLFETERGKEMVHDQQVWIIPLEHKTFLEDLATNFVLKSYIFSALPLYEKIFAVEVERLKTKYAFYLSLQAGITLEYSDHGRGFFSNFFRNAFSLPNAYLANKLFDKFQGVPAIICGAGPSLDKNVHQLEALSDRALIFAGGTAMNALNANGVIPHLGVGIDPNPAQFTRLIMNQAFEVPFLYRNRFLHEALEIIHGDHLYVTGSSGYDIAEWFEDKLGIQRNEVSEGYNVLNFSVSLAAAMGCNPIILVGVDLAYTNGQSYASGIVHHPLHNRKTFFRTKSQDEELVSHTDLEGKPTLTLWKWVSESLWFTQFARTHPNALLINATEGGIGFAAIPNMTLEEVSKLLKKQYDIKGMLSAEIHKAEVPPTVNTENIRKIVKEMLESMKRSLEYSRIVYADFEEVEQKLKEGKEVPENFISEKGFQALASLEDEPSYISILKIFSESYMTKFTRDFQRLKYDESLLTDQELKLKRARLNSSRYKFLIDTAKVHIRLMEKVIFDEEESKKLMLFKDSKKREAEQKKPIEYVQGEIYSFKDGVITIRDKEMGLSIEEPFVPDEVEGISRKIHPGGALQIEQFFLNGRLHGPSRNYAESGQLLSEFWYVQGKIEGKGHTHYLSGAISSLERYKNGKREGIQEYYYPDGTLKTVLHYVGGVLEGEVKLYYPTGRLKRELHFKEGKRKGIEKIWNEVGTLIIEAEFDMDKGVGTARKWRPNGNISREVIFEPEFNKSVVREWDEYGNLLSVDDSTSSDFFDQVAKHAGKLTESLETILKQIKKVAPMVEAASTKDPKKENIAEVYKELNRISEQMGHLHEINNKLSFESGVNPNNLEEAIWKTPTSRREVEKQVEIMTQDMVGEMTHIQSMMTETLGLLAKKLGRKGISDAELP